MAVNTNKDLILSFERQDGKNHNMTIPDYKEGITDEQVKTGGAGIITEGIFEPDGYALVKLTAAVKVDTTKTDVLVEVD